jgi:hypothetical protein
MKLGAPHGDPKLMLNEQKCARESITQYLDKERKCRACIRADREKEGRVESGEEKEREVWGEKREIV